MLNEYADDSYGFEEHFWYAMGHLGEASDESKGYVFSKLIRAHRSRMTEDEDYWIEFSPLIRLASRYAGLDTAEEIDMDEFFSLMEECKRPVEDFMDEEDMIDRHYNEKNDPSKKKITKKISKKKA